MSKDGWGRDVIISHSLDVIQDYAGTPITIRQLYYRLVAQGMPNIQKVYKRVVAAMTSARWAGIVRMEAFIDRERAMVGRTASDETTLEVEIEEGKEAIRIWMEAYGLNRWENQPEYIEVWVEKKALQGVLERPCQAMSVGLGPCKGYPSLTFLNEARFRFLSAHLRGKKCSILYFGDYDPSGVDIPRSLQENIHRMGSPLNIEIIALNIDQIQEYSLPGVPAKVSDSRSAYWTGDVVELDAMDPRTLGDVCRRAILDHFDKDLYKELEDREDEEREEYQTALAEHVREIVEEME